VQEVGSRTGEELEEKDFDDTTEIRSVVVVDMFDALDRPMLAS